VQFDLIVVVGLDVIIFLKINQTMFLFLLSLQQTTVLVEILI
jgi:hypothetical protein